MYMFIQKYKNRCDLKWRGVECQCCLAQKLLQVIDHGHLSSFWFHLVTSFIHVYTCITLWQKQSVLPHLCSVIHQVICVIISLKENRWATVRFCEDIKQQYVCWLEVFFFFFFLWTPLTWFWMLRYWHFNEAKPKNKYF